MPNSFIKAVPEEVILAMRFEDNQRRFGYWSAPMPSYYRLEGYCSLAILGEKTAYNDDKLTFEHNGYVYNATIVSTSDYDRKRIGLTDGTAIFISNAQFRKIVAGNRVEVGDVTDSTVL